MPPPPSPANLLQERINAERTYNDTLRDPQNDATNDDANIEQINRRLYDSQQLLINAANAYRDALVNDNNASEQDKQASRDYVNQIDRLPNPNSSGGRRRSSAKKHASHRKPRSTKKRATRRYRRRRA